MKQITLMLLVLLTSKIYSQEIVGKSYMTIVDKIKVKDVVNNREYLVDKGIKFSIDGIDGNDVLVTFWNFKIGKGITQQNKKDGSGIITAVELTTLFNKEKRLLTASDIKNKLNLQYEYIGYWANHLQFKMKLQDLNDKTIKYYSASHNFTYGVMTLPIKVRFGNGNERFFNLEENLNLGFTFGYQKQLPSRVKQSINFLGGVGISRVTFDEDTIPNATTEEETAAALMLNIGCLYQYETFQVGAFFGTDLIPGSVGKSWAFQGKPWLGIAIGVSLFTNDKEKQGQLGNQ